MPGKPTSLEAIGEAILLSGGTLTITTSRLITADRIIALEEIASVGDSVENIPILLPFLMLLLGVLAVTLGFAHEARGHAVGWLFFLFFGMTGLREGVMRRRIVWVQTPSGTETILISRNRFRVNRVVTTLRHAVNSLDRARSRPLDPSLIASSGPIRPT